MGSMTDSNPPSPAPESSRKSVLRGAGIMSLMTALSRVLGLVREQVRSFYLGTGMESDAFGIASVLPNLLRRLFAEGAMTAAFVPVFADFRRNRSPEELQSFLSQFITWLSFLVTLVTGVAYAATPWLIETLFPGFGVGTEKSQLTIVLTQVMWPYLILVSLAAVAQAVLNSFRIFAPSAFTPVLLNLLIIGTVVGFQEYFETPAHAFAWGFVLGGMAQLGFQIPYLSRQGLSIRLEWTLGPGVKRVLRIAAPGIFAAGIYQVNVLVAQFVAASLPEGAVASLQYSLRLQELVLGLFAISITTVILPVMSDQVVTKDTEGVKDTLGFATGLVALVTLPASVGLWLLGEPIVSVLFEFGAFDSESTSKTVSALQFHAAGIFFIAWSRIVTQVFYAQEDLKTPTLVAGGVMLFHGILCFVLAEPLQQGGIALAGGIAALVNGVILWGFLGRKMGTLVSPELVQGLGKTIVATAVMGVCLVGVERFFPVPDSRVSQLIWLFAQVGVGIAVFFGMAKGLGSSELREVAQVVRRRRMP